MIYTIINQGGGKPLWWYFSLVVSYALILFVMLPVHEMAHAYTAVKLGDNTSRWHGRLSFNPLRHLDIIGTALLVLFGFGYAKPVPVNPRNFSRPKRDMALTALAGPVSNILLALISFFLIRVILSTGVAYGFGWYVCYALFICATVNLNLAVFNLLPIPPLDGSRIFSAFLPSRWVYYMEQYRQYLTIALFFLIATDVLDKPLMLLTDGLATALCALTGLDFPSLVFMLMR